MNETTETKPTAPAKKGPPPGVPAIEVADKPTAKTIAVKSLTFFQAHPDYNARSSIAAEPAANKGKVVIEFVPSLRHHRVETHAPGQAMPRVRFIYEGHVASWEPLTQ